MIIFRLLKRKLLNKWKQMDNNLYILIHNIYDLTFYLNFNIDVYMIFNIKIL